MLDLVGEVKPLIGLVYLAYPIDAAGGEESFLDLVRYATCELVDRGATVYDPGDAFTVGVESEMTGGLERINRAALLESDRVLAFLPVGVPTIGVPIEIDRAIGAGKPVGVITDQRSWMLAGMDIDFMGAETKPAVQWTIDSLLAVPTRNNGILRFAQTVPGQGTVPTRGHPGDAGLDLIVNEKSVLGPGAFGTVSTGLAVELPDWGWGLITGRSSALLRGLLVKDAVIDSGYRGELFVNCWNLTDETVVVEAGQRVAQLVLMPNLTRGVRPVMAQALSETSRGTRGFGSTGL